MSDTSESAAAWVFDRDDRARLRDAAAIAQGRLTEPDLELATVSSRGDVVTMQITRGEIGDPTDLLQVERLGLFEILRIEPWPGGRILLVLRAWPSPA
jgi:hypothetical protein